ncbi:hypothetical protein B0H13DRAFT_1898491 [Mycena leptocephala]|nr:hypothetical protein B0H13DRAFT_1898491 [Mycena leptocephala]
MKGLREERQALERAFLEETLARAQDGFAFKVKIDTLLVENSRLTTALKRKLEGTIEPQEKTKWKKNNAEDKEDKSKERRPAEQGLTIQQNKDLATKIGKLKGPRLEKVIRIIHEGSAGHQGCESVLFKTVLIANVVASTRQNPKHCPNSGSAAQLQESPNCFDDPDSRTLDPLPDKATHQRSPVHWRKNSRTQTAPRPGFRRGRARHACAAARR